MKTFILTLGLACILAAPVLAQVYDEKHESIVAPLDRAVEQANAMYEEVPVAGAEDEAKTMDQRYEEMTTAVNEANDRHFNAVIGVNTIVEEENAAALLK